MIKRTQAVRISQLSFAEDLREELDAYKDSPQSPESFETSFVHSDVDYSDPTDFTGRFHILVEQFKRQSIQHFAEMHKAYHSDQAASAAQERRRVESQLEAKQDQIERLQNDLTNAMAMVRSLQAQNKKLTQCIHKQFSFHTLRQAFACWTQAHSRLQRAKLQLQQTLHKAWLSRRLLTWKTNARVPRVLQPVASPQKLEWKPSVLGAFRLHVPKPESVQFNLENFHPRTKRSLACKDRYSAR